MSHFLVIERYPSCNGCDRWFEADAIPDECPSHECKTDLRDSNNVNWNNEFEITHDDDCPEVVRYSGGAIGVPDVMEPVCNVGLEWEAVGTDALGDVPGNYATWQDVPAGKYEIEWWVETYPGGYWGDTECDTGLNFVDFERDSK